MRKSKVPFDAPLHPLDTEDMTFGCRNKNSDRCMYNQMEDICAFVRTDGLCQKPCGTWKAQYACLLKDRE